MSGRNIKAFLDSNTIISGLLFEGNEATLLELGRIKAIKLITNQYVIDEVTQVLKRQEFHLTSKETQSLTRYLYTCLTITENPPKEAIQEHINMLKDKKDIPVALGAIQTKTDYLVTGNKELQNHPNLPTISTKNLLEKILPKKPVTKQINPRENFFPKYPPVETKRTGNTAQSP